MLTASGLIWRLAGSAGMPGCVQTPDAVCYLCGGKAERGTQVSAWAGDTFTDANRARAPHSTIVCEACVFVCSRLSPVPGHPPADGKKLGGNYRNYSHLYEEGDLPWYAAPSKGDKATIRAFLRRVHNGPWFAGIADSGQRHLIPWIPMNPAGARAGRILFEDAEIRIPAPDANDWQLVDAMTAVMDAGASKEGVLTGDYSPIAWARFGPAISEFERTWGRLRPSRWWTLCAWLAQRTEVNNGAGDGTETGGMEAADDRGDHGGPIGVSGGGSDPEEALGSDHGTDPGRVPDVAERRRVGIPPVPAAAPAGTRPVQLALL